MDELTELAIAAQGGDRTALAALVRDSQADVWRFCAHLTSVAEADDLTQETFVRAFRSLPAFRGDSSVRTWLLAIARRVVVDDIRGRDRRRRLTDRLRPVQEEAVVPAPDGDVADLLTQLDDDRRTAFVLTQAVGLSYAEAAEVCGCPVGTIRSRVARARDELADAVRRAEVE